MTTPQQTHCGYIAIIGRPNVGKSTLLNTLIGQPISIATRRPQTTRHRILAIDTDGDHQCIFLDTPGMHTQHANKLNHRIHRAAIDALPLANLLVFVIDHHHWTDDDNFVLEQIKRYQLPTLLVVNKIDRIQDSERMQEHISWLCTEYPFTDTLMLSARSPKQVAGLKRALHSHLPANPHIFQEDQLTDRSWPFIACERVRGALMNALHDELPYSVHVTPELWEETEDKVEMALLIWVAKDNHKSIVIGKGGSNLKRVGQRARLALESLMGKKIHMKLWVKVKADWTNDSRTLQQAGY